MCLILWAMLACESTGVQRLAYQILIHAFSTRSSDVTAVNLMAVLRNGIPAAIAARTAEQAYLTLFGSAAIGLQALHAILFSSEGAHDHPYSVRWCTCCTMRSDMPAVTSLFHSF